LKAEGYIVLERDLATIPLPGIDVPCAWRFIEIGPSPTLTGMAVQTLKARYEAKDNSTSLVRRVFCVSKHQKDIYYQFEDEPEVTSESDPPSESATPTPSPPVAAPVVVANPTPVATAGPAASIEDVPILAAIASQTLKKQLSEIPLSKSIKHLSNGKSTLQNEIMGDL
jgi:fatty acid synthase subunit alpha